MQKMEKRDRGLGYEITQYGRAVYGADTQIDKQVKWPTLLVEQFENAKKEGDREERKKHTLLFG